ncbi:muscarinic acetylcholine receptor M5-like [Mytilus trossulus]|uniref:muscarinic acetylcholine receptor M5-like n=1 Tax=Mytilus trossulus TaxID=6551 RepID=UPI0030066879
MINTTETEEEEEDIPFPLYLVVIFGITISLCVFFGFVGNLLTILAYIRDKQLHSVYNAFLLNLAITDILLSTISMPFYAVYTLETYTWPFGYHFCKMYMLIDFTLCLESVLMMMVISIDRLLLLKFGPHYSSKVTMKKAGIQIGVTWVLAFLLYGPAIIGWDIWTGENIVEEEDCDVQFAYDTAFTTATAFIEFGIPFCCIVIVNGLIYNEIRKRSKVGVNASKPSNHNNNKPKREVKAVRFLAALVVVFFVTWVPYTITTIIIAFCEECVNENLYEIFNWVLWSKAAMNPFLYAYNSTRFRKNFSEMIPCFKSFGVSKVKEEHSVTPNAVAVTTNTDDITPNTSAVTPNISTVTSNISTVTPNISAVTTNTDAIKPISSAETPYISAIAANISASTTLKVGVKPYTVAVTTNTSDVTNNIVV